MDWLRLYTDVLDDRRFFEMPAELYRAWTMLLMVTRKHDGILPPIHDIAFALRITDEDAAATLAGLDGYGLIDHGEAGDCPHNWLNRQYDSDSSTLRVRRHRAARRAVNDETLPKRSGETSRNVSVTPPEQIQTQNRAEQNRTDTPATAGAGGAPIGAHARAGRARGEPEPFIAIYERHPRKGDRARACKVFRAAEKRGVPSAELIAGHGRWVAYWDEAATPEDKIPYLATWLNNERWGDAPPPVHAPRPPAPNGDGRRHDPTVERPLDAARYTGDGKYARFFARRDDGE